MSASDDFRGSTYKDFFAGQLDKCHEDWWVSAGENAGDEEDGGGDAAAEDVDVGTGADFEASAELVAGEGKVLSSDFGCGPGFMECFQ